MKTMTICKNLDLVAVEVVVIGGLIQLTASNDVRGYQGLFIGGPVADIEKFFTKVVSAVRESENPLGMLMNAPKWEGHVYRLSEDPEDPEEDEIRGEAEMNRE